MRDGVIKRKLFEAAAVFVGGLQHQHQLQSQMTVRSQSASQAVLLDALSNLRTTPTLEMSPEARPAVVYKFHQLRIRPPLNLRQDRGAGLQRTVVDQVKPSP